MVDYLKKSKNDIYHKMTKKYYNVLQTLDFNKDGELINYISGQYKEAIALLASSQSITVYWLLNDISFTNHLKDKAILEAVQSDKMVIFYDNYFIKIGNFLYKDDEAFYEIRENNDQSYVAKRYLDGQVTEENLTVKDLNNFISLKKAIYNSKCMGYIAKQEVGNVSLLYDGIISEDKIFMLHIYNGVLKFYVTDDPYVIESYIETENEAQELNQDGNDIGSKEFIYNTVVNQLQKQYGNDRAYKRSRN